MTIDIYAIDDVTYEAAESWFVHHFGNQAVFEDEDERLFCYAHWSDFDKDDIPVSRHYFDEYGDYKPEFEDTLRLKLD